MTKIQINLVVPDDFPWADEAPDRLVVQGEGFTVSAERLVDAGDILYRGQLDS